MTWQQIAGLHLLAVTILLAWLWRPRRTTPKPPVPGAAAQPPGAGSPAPGSRPAGALPPAARQPGSHVHNPYAPPVSITYKFGCGCTRTLGPGGRKLATRTCPQAADWAQWQREVDAL